MTDRAANNRIRYRFGPLEQRGLVAGWRGGQILSVAAGLVVAVGTLRASTAPVHLVLAAATVGLAVAFALWPIGGRTGEQWLPVVAGWLWLQATARGRWRSPLPGAGWTAPTGPAATGAAPASGRGLGTAGPFAGCTIAASSRVGYVHDRKARTLTAALAVRGSGFTLLSPDDQHRAVASWAGVLAALAHEGTDVHRLQWIERTLPDDACELRRYRDDQRVLPDDAPAARSYEELLRTCADGTVRHETLLAVTVRERRTPWGRGSTAPEIDTVLLTEVRALAARLRHAGLTVEGVLSPRALSTAIRRAVEPARAALGDGCATDSVAWPLAIEAGWSEVRTDASFHAVYWIAEWPRTDVGADFLAPLLLRSGLRRTMAVTMEPVSPLRAQREAESARIADIADRRLRQRGGFLLTARRQREEEGVSRREVEIADGHGQYRFTGFVAVSADDLEGLAEARKQLEDAAGQSRLALRPLYGDQERGFACLLPLGRGLA